MRDAPELPIALDRELAAPLAVQLADAVRAAAAGGTLRVGDRLPSTRVLAGRLGVSRTVTAAAYEQLHAEGWLAGRHGSGTYVAATPQRPGHPPRPPARPATRAPRELLDLTPGSSWAAGLDPAAWRRAWRAGGDATPLSRPERGGLPAYRAAVAEHLLRHRGLAAGEEAVLATGGTTAALLEVAQAVLARDTGPVAVEEPGYQRAVGVLKAAGHTVLPAPVDAHGLVVDALPAGIAAVYCTPAHQYPLGGRLPADRRVALVDRARAEGFWVIEDDYDGELRYDVAPLPMLAALGPDVVLHLGTTSKIFSATLGAGWLVAPPPVAAAILAHRDSTGTAPAAAGQRVLTELARHGDPARHLRRLRRELAARREILVTGLTKAGIPVEGDDAGAHLLVPLPDTAAEERAVRTAERAGLRLDSLARHYAGPPQRAGIPLGYAVATQPELQTALPTLTAVLAATHR